jgi:hypothetical protein
MIKEGAKQFLNDKRGMSGHAPEDIDPGVHLGGRERGVEEEAAEIELELKKKQMKDMNRREEQEAKEAELARKTSEEKEQAARNQAKTARKEKVLSTGKNALTGSMAGSMDIFLAIIGDIAVASFFLMGGSALIGALVIHLFLYWRFQNSFGNDRALHVFLGLNVIPLLFSSIALGRFLDGTNPATLTLGNGLIPLWFLYAGLLKNTGKGLLAKGVYIFLFAGLAGWAISEGHVETVYAEAAAASPEQAEAASNIITNVVNGVGTSATLLVGGIKNSPNAVAGWLNPQVAAAGGKDLFSETKQQPKLGLSIEANPLGSATFIDDDTIAASAILKQIQPIPDNPVLRVTRVQCQGKASDPKDAAKPGKDELQSGRVIVGPNSLTTIACNFRKDEVGSSFKVLAEYEFRETAELTTYFVRKDVLDSAIVNNEDLLDFYKVPPLNRNPRTKVDNGPVDVGIGPAELLFPPLGIEAGREYPSFQLAVRPRSTFDGEIAEIRKIIITLPTGISLVNAEQCGFKPVEKILSRPPAASRFDNGITGSAIDVPDIPQPPSTEGPIKYESYLDEKNSRLMSKFTAPGKSVLFSCDMAINPALALGNAAFREAKFNVDISFVYRTERQISMGGI